MTTQQENEEDVCDMCEGLGEVQVDEPVYPGEPHMAPVGMRPCPKCNINEEEYDD